MIWDTGPPVWDHYEVHFTNSLSFCYALSLVLFSRIFTFTYSYPYPETGLTLSLSRSIPDGLYGPVHFPVSGHARRTMRAQGALRSRTGAFFLTQAHTRASTDAFNV